MSLFKRPVEYSLDACQRALRENAAAIAAAEQEVAEHSLAGVTGDDRRAEDAARRLVELQSQRRVLEQAERQVADKEQDAAAQREHKAALARARALDAHLGRLRKACGSIADDLAALTLHWTEALEGLARAAAVVGDPRGYPGMSAVELRRAIDAELWRVSAVPTQWGDRSDLIAAPPGAGPANRLPALTEIVGSLTKHWAARHRAALGLAPASAPRPVDAREVTPPSDTIAEPFVPSAPVAEGRRTGLSLAEMKGL